MSLLDGLVGWWRMEEDPAIHGSTIVDNSGYGNHGTLSTSDGAVNKSVVGKLGRGLSFDGSNDYVSIGNPASLNFGIGNFTISAWIKTSYTYGDNDGHIVGKREGSNKGYRFQMSVNKIHTKLYDGAFETTLTGNKIVNDGLWHYVVLVKSPIVYLYVDGNVDNSTSLTAVSSLDTIDSLFIGRQSANNGRYFNGVIDEVRIYNRALSAGEVAFLANPKIPQIKHHRSQQGN